MTQTNLKDKKNKTSLKNPVNIANFLSLARLLAVPLLVWLLINNEYTTLFYAVIIVSITDALDGFIARRFDCESELGKTLDPMADKALLVCLFITLTYKGFIPTWLAVSVVSRDLLIVTGVLVAHVLDKKLIISPIYISKVNTVLQLVTVLYIIMSATFTLWGTWHFHLIANTLFWSTLFTTIVSTAKYIIIWLKCVQSD